MEQLPANIKTKIESLIREGGALKEQRLYKDAIKPYTEAFQELPDPREDWDVSIGLFLSLGDCHFALEEYGASDYFYNQVLFCDEGFGSAEAWLGIGKSRFELEDMDKAKEALLSAYMLEGKDIFSDKDSKYFKFLEANVSLTA